VWRYSGWLVAGKEKNMGKMAKVHYLLSEEGRKKSLLFGGDGKELQTIEVDATPEIIQLGSVSVEGNISLQVGFKKNRLDSFYKEVMINKKIEKAYFSPGYRWIEESKVAYFDEPKTVAFLVEWETTRVKRIKEAEENAKLLIVRYQAEYNTKKKEQEEEKKKRAEEQRLYNEKKAAEKEALEKDKLDWINHYGSDHLKRAVRLGYVCQRKYVKERAAKEFPDFIVDLDNIATWNTISCPSLAKLSEVEKLIERGYKAEVVWLTSPAYYLNEEDFDDFEPSEAIVVHDYLGEFTLVG